VDLVVLGDLPWLPPPQPAVMMLIEATASVSGLRMLVATALLTIAPPFGPRANRHLRRSPAAETKRTLRRAHTATMSVATPLGSGNTPGGVGERLFYFV
jgi:hypothetical protein